MKKHLLLLTAPLILTAAHGQNLVPNPSFEIIDSLKCALHDIRVASPWFGMSSDYFNTTNYTGACGLLAPGDGGWIGYQYPRTGNGHSGFGFSNDSCSSSGREHAEVKLNSQLIAGKLYCVEFYVSIYAKLDEINFGCDCIQAVFSSDTLFQSPPCWEIIQYAPIKNPYGNVLKDTLNWQKVSGIYDAIGGETFLTIGCFSPFDSITPNYQTANYYFLDDVSVYLCDSTPEPLNDTTVYVPNAFSPNGDGENDTFFIKGNLDKLHCVILNRWGEQVAELNLPKEGWDGRVNGLECNSGVYLYYLTGKEIGGKEIIKKGNITLLR